MASNDPPEPKPGPRGDPEPIHADALRQLEQRLDRASEVAERLIAEAAARVVRRSPGADARDAASDLEGANRVQAERKPPPAGWQIRDHGEDRADETTRNSGSGVHGEVDLLLHVLGSLRDRIPPELQRRLGEAVRELLLALRAVIDWYLERSAQRAAEPQEVQDIPIV